MPIPDVNNNRKREPVNKTSWSPNDGPAQNNKKSWSHDDGPAQNKQGLKVFMICFEPNRNHLNLDNILAVH